MLELTTARPEQVKVDRWLDKEGSTVTISLDFTPSLDANDERSASGPTNATCNADPSFCPQRQYFTP